MLIVIPFILFILLKPSTYQFPKTLFLIITLSLFTLIPYQNNSLRLINYNIYYILDPLAYNLIILTIWVTTLIIIVRKKFFDTRNFAKPFLSTCIILCLILMLAFSTNSIIVFYILFEASLIPTLILIIVWGYQPERILARFFLILYTVFRSLPLLLTLLRICNYTSSTSFHTQNAVYSSCSLENYLYVFLIIAFLVKLPIYFFHIWLPKAHVEAPLAGSIVLAAILLKLGGYGLIRLRALTPWIIRNLLSKFTILSLLGAIITSLICTRQTDLKALIAYSSVSHIGLILAAISTFEHLAWLRAIIMLCAHGLGSSMLFCLAATAYEKSNSRRLILTKGLLKITPVFSFFWFIGAILRIGAPPFINLTAEILITQSLIIKTFYLTPILIATLFLRAVYSLILYTSSNHGPICRFTKKTSSFSNLLTLSFIIHITPAAILIGLTKFFYF